MESPWGCQIVKDLKGHYSASGVGGLEALNFGIQLLELGHQRMARRRMATSSGYGGRKCSTLGVMAWLNIVDGFTCESPLRLW